MLLIYIYYHFLFAILEICYNTTPIILRLPPNQFVISPKNCSPRVKADVTNWDYLSISSDWFSSLDMLPKKTSGENGGTI